jgi:hypothetical protein
MEGPEPIKQFRFFLKNQCPNFSLEELTELSRYALVGGEDSVTHYLIKIPNRNGDFNPYLSTIGSMTPIVTSKDDMLPRGQYLYCFLTTTYPKNFISSVLPLIGNCSLSKKVTEDQLNKYLAYQPDLPSPPKDFQSVTFLDGKKDDNPFACFKARVRDQDKYYFLWLRNNVEYRNSIIRYLTNPLPSSFDQTYGLNSIELGQTLEIHLHTMAMYFDCYSSSNSFSYRPIKYADLRLPFSVNPAHVAILAYLGL